VAKPSGKTVKQRLTTVEGDENHDKAYAQHWPMLPLGNMACVFLGLNPVAGLFTSK